MDNIKLETPFENIFAGNILLVVCCIFYLAWWLLSFKPVGAIKGIKSGWLLIPAFVAGIAALILLIQGIMNTAFEAALFQGKWIIIGGISIYILLLLVTSIAIHRPVTSELLLIVGWAMLSLQEINILYGFGTYSHTGAIIFMIITVVATIISLVCYVLYYNLDKTAGYVDGMVPLIMVGSIMLFISIKMILKH